MLTHAVARRQLGVVLVLLSVSGLCVATEAVSGSALQAKQRELLARKRPLSLPKRSAPVPRRDGEEDDTDKVVLQHASKVFNNFLSIMHDPNNEENLKQNFASMAGTFVACAFDAVKRGEITSMADEQEVRQYVYHKFSLIFDTVKRHRAVNRKQGVAHDQSPETARAVASGE